MHVFPRACIVYAAHVCLLLVQCAQHNRRVLTKHRAPCTMIGALQGPRQAPVV